MADISDDEEVCPQLILDSRTENGKTEYLIQQAQQCAECEWVAANEMRKKYDAKFMLDRYRHECKVIQRLNEDTLDDPRVPEKQTSGTARKKVKGPKEKLVASRTREFGMKRTGGVNATKVLNVIRHEGVRVCEVDWEKNGKYFSTDFVSYHEVYYLRPDLLVDWFEEYLYRDEEEVSE